MNLTPAHFPNKAILNLVLKRKWFDMIFYGDKREEYRENKPHWQRIFKEGKIKIAGKLYNPTDVVIRFNLGYQSDRQVGYIDCLGLTVGEGKKEWGYIKGTQPFILKLGKIY